MINGKRASMHEADSMGKTPIIFFFAQNLAFEESSRDRKPLVMKVSGDTPAVKTAHLEKSFELFHPIRDGGKEKCAQE